MAYLIWRARCAWHLLRRSPANYTLRDAWTSASCFEDWQNNDPIQCAEDELSYLAADAGA